MHNLSDEPVYVISVAARLARLPSWFLRVLDEEGLVVPVRTDSNRRLYSDRDLALLSRVRLLTAPPPEGRGVNIAGVKVIFEMEREKEQSASQDAETQAAGNASAPTPALLPPYLDTRNT